MSNVNRPGYRPGWVLGALSLICFGAAVGVGLMAAAIVYSDLSTTPPQAGTGAVIRGGVVVLLAILGAILCCAVGAVFGLGGVVLACLHPGSKPLLPIIGLVMNALPLLAALALKLWPYLS